MIDWLTVLYHTFWILGLAAMLAAFSLAEWSANGSNQSFRQCLAQPPFRFALATGSLLVMLGLMLITGSWWQKLGWAGLVVVTLWESGVAGQKWFNQARER